MPASSAAREVRLSLYDHPFSPRGSQSARPIRAIIAAEGDHTGAAKIKRAERASSPRPPAYSSTQHPSQPVSPSPANSSTANAASESAPVPVPAALGAAGGAAEPATAVPATVSTSATAVPEASATAAAATRPQTAASDTSSSSASNMGDALDGPIPWGYRSGDSASTRALGRTWKYGDDEDLGASRTGFIMPKHLPSPEPPKKLDAAAADAALESVVPLALPNADARRPAAVDELLQNALIALRSKPPLPSAAIKHLDAVVDANPHCQPALKLRAGAHCMLAHYSQALADADAALYLAPMDEMSWLWKATAHDHLNEYAEAVAAYTAGLQYEPTNARLQKGYIAAVERANRAGEKRDTLKFRGSRTLRDSEYAFTSSQVTEHTKASARDASRRKQLEAEPGVTYEPADPVAARKAELKVWRKESTAEVAASLAVGTPSTLNLVTWLAQDVDFLRDYYDTTSTSAASDGAAAGGGRGQYEVELNLIINNAIRQLDVFFPGNPHSNEKAERPAIIFDVDETALTSVPRGRECGFQSISELEHLWLVSASAPAIPGVLRLFQWVRENRPEVEIFFLSGRRKKEFHATQFNLKREGFYPYSRLIVREEVDNYTTMALYKLEQRRELEEQGYTIVATIGDQWSDFDGGHTGYVVKLPNYLYTIE